MSARISSWRAPLSTPTQHEQTTGGEGATHTHGWIGWFSQTSFPLVSNATRRTDAAVVVWRRLVGDELDGGAQLLFWAAAVECVCQSNEQEATGEKRVSYA